MKDLIIFLINIIKKHWLCFVFALAIGILAVLPTIVSIHSIGFANFNGVYPLLNKDEQFYLALTREALDGYNSIGNAYYFEGKANPGTEPILAPIFFSKIAAFFNISVPDLFFINDFVIPFCSVIFLYVLLYYFSQNKKLSALGSLFFHLLFLNDINRPINPQLSFALLIVGVILIWKIFENYTNSAKNFIYSFILGCLVAFLFYIYPFAWTALFVLYFICMFLFFQKKYLFYYFKLLSSFFLPFILIIIPFLLNIKQAISSPYYNETMSRMGMLNNHWPACYSNVAIVFATLVALIASKKFFKNKISYLFSLSLLISSLVLNWQNVITGKYIQFSSHYNMITIFYSLLVLFLAALYLHDEIKISKKENLIKKVLLIICILAVASNITIRKLPKIKDSLLPIVIPIDISNAQKMNNLYSWFNKNTKKDSVVYALCTTCAENFSIYTSNNLYFDGYGGNFIASDNEIEDRWIRQYIFFDNIDKEYIKNHERIIWLNKFIDKYQNQSIRNSLLSKITGIKFPELIRLPEVYPERVWEKYKELKKENPEQVLKKHKIDYIVLEANNEAYEGMEEKFGEYDFLEYITKIDNYLIYKVE